MYQVTVYDRQARTIDSTSVETWAEVVAWLEQYQNAVIEYFSPTSAEVSMRQLGRTLCFALDQESYGLTREDVQVEFVKVQSSPQQEV